MKVFMASLESVSPYSQSRPHETPKLDGESGDAYDVRTWREHCHYRDDGRLFIPPTCFKESLVFAAKVLGMRIKGRGTRTYKDHFAAGVIVQQPLDLPVTKETVKGERLFLNADGRKGGGVRVWRTYPLIPRWAGDVAFFVYDETITAEVMRKHLDHAGALSGIGRFRPEKGGWYGRFVVREMTEMAA